MFFEEHKSTDVECIPIHKALSPIEPDVLERLTGFTLTIFDDVFSKEYEATAADLPYFLAPSAYGHDFDYLTDGNLQNIIDWTALSTIGMVKNTEYPDNEPDGFFQDKFVTDPWDGSRKFFLHGRRRDMKPLDPIPSSVVLSAHRIWKTVPHDIYNYSISLWTKSRKSASFRKDQPVVEAEILPIRRNFLDDTIREEDFLPRKCFIILEPLRISPVSHHNLHS